MPNTSFNITLTFNYEINSSVQVGDQVYWTGVDALSGFTHDSDLGLVVHIGTITKILHHSNTIGVLSYHVDPITGNPLPLISPPLESFISFSKNNVVNNNDLTGYYATVQFVNDSRTKAELFSVGSGVSESSK